MKLRMCAVLLSIYLSLTFYSSRRNRAIIKYRWKKEAFEYAYEFFKSDTIEKKN